MTSGDRPRCPPLMGTRKAAEIRHVPAVPGVPSEMVNGASRRISVLLRQPAVRWEDYARITTDGGDSGDTWDSAEMHEVFVPVRWGQWGHT
jgi:hypothetical protein